MRPSTSLGPVLGCLLALAGCDSSTPEPMGPDASSPPAVPTYYGEVRPILTEACVSCHSEGSIAPFGLETYLQAREVAARMAEVTRDRIMPPFLADNSGSCNTWANFRGLSDDEIATIGAWVEGGMLEGDPSIVAPEVPPLPSLDSVDIDLTMPDTYTLDESDDDDYRCFLVDPGTTEDVYVTGYNVVPGNTARVHHVIVYNPADDAAVSGARDLDSADGSTTDGYTCFGGPRVDASPLAIWAPGGGALRFPRSGASQTGVLLEAGRTQIIQVHYNNLVPDSANTDRTHVELQTTPVAGSTAWRGFFFPIADLEMSLAPRMESVETSVEWPLSWFLPDSVPLLPVMGVLPHMHTLGRSLTVELIDPAAGTEECMIDVPRWDFNWQMAYFLNRAQYVSRDQSVRLTCRYDTTERDGITTWGDGTQDEMCLAYFYVVVPPS